MCKFELSANRNVQFELSANRNVQIFSFWQTWKKWFTLGGTEFGQNLYTKVWKRTYTPETMLLKFKTWVTFSSTNWSSQKQTWHIWKLWTKWNRNFSYSQHPPVNLDFLKIHLSIILARINILTSSFFVH